MKKVLIIAHVFTEKKFVSAMRMQGLAKCLPEFHWKPVILTVKSPVKPDPRFKLVITPYEDGQNNLKKKLGFKEEKTVKEQMGLPTYKGKKTVIDIFLNLWLEFFNYPDREKSWYKFAVEAGNKLLQKEHFDAIISTSSPVTAHLIAKELKNKHGIPWIADFRDLWTQNHYYSHTLVRKLIERKLEIKTLSKTDALVTVSGPLADKLKIFHKKEAYVITNGFDVDEVKNFDGKLTDKFTITYTGALYHGKRDPSTFFAALQDLISNGDINPNAIEIRFFGINEGWLEQDIKSYNLQNVVKFYGFVDHNTILKKQRESQLLLLLLWDHPEERGVYTGKLFEYLSSKRPILALGGSTGVVKDLLDVTNAGRFAVSIEELKEYVMDSYYEWMRRGEVSFHGKMFEINKYSQREMAKKFAKVLEEICKN